MTLSLICVLVLLSACFLGIFAQQQGYQQGYDQSGYQQGYDQSGYQQGYDQRGYGAQQQYHQYHPQQHQYPEQSAFQSVSGFAPRQLSYLNGDEQRLFSLLEAKYKRDPNSMNTVQMQAYWELQAKSRGQPPAQPAQPSSNLSPEEEQLLLLLKNKQGALNSVQQQALQALEAKAAGIAVAGAAARGVSRNAGGSRAQGTRRGGGRR